MGKHMRYCVWAQAVDVVNSHTTGFVDWDGLACCLRPPWAGSYGAVKLLVKLHVGPSSGIQEVKSVRHRARVKAVLAQNSATCGMLKRFMNSSHMDWRRPLPSAMRTRCCFSTSRTGWFSRTYLETPFQQQVGHSVGVLIQLSEGPLLPSPLEDQSRFVPVASHRFRKDLGNGYPTCHFETCPTGASRASGLVLGSVKLVLKHVEDQDGRENLVPRQAHQQLQHEQQGCGTR
ncbi:hypothetical protein EYF80_019008 [Liparis tanakae]|uniref:Uncharacterized protein n=1 Tax=Liparis tanakae TaxID=230148 RepID=A0A4Z2HZF5_9TELE|nr:hypothetical protein EYF80_019008 [Liparis tanakae]